MRSLSNSKLYTATLICSVSALFNLTICTAQHPAGQGCDCQAGGGVTAHLGDSGSNCGCGGGSADCGCGGGSTDCDCGAANFGQGMPCGLRGLKLPAVGRRNAACGGECGGGCDSCSGGRPRLFSANPIARGPATGLSLFSRGAACGDDCGGCENCRGGLLGGIGQGRIASRMTGGGLGSRADAGCADGSCGNGGLLANVFGGRRGQVGCGNGGCGLGGNGLCGGCRAGLAGLGNGGSGNGVLGGLGHGGLGHGGLGHGGLGLGHGGLGLGNGGLGNGIGGCGRGGCGLGGNGLCGGCMAGHGLAGGIPHTAQVPQGMGGQSPTTAYPYYTTRGPRDFLMDNPPSIGW